MNPYRFVRTALVRAGTVDYWFKTGLSIFPGGGPKYRRPGDAASISERKRAVRGYKAVLTTLKTGSASGGIDAVLLQFERPADQSETAKSAGPVRAEVLVDRYAKPGAEDSWGTSAETDPTEAGNKYITKAKGGWSDAIKGKPADALRDSFQIAWLCAWRAI